MEGLRDLLMLAVFLLGASAVWYYAFCLKQLVQKSFSWPSTKGKILRSKVAEGGKNSFGTKVAKIKYTYNVVGRSYTSNRICIGGDLYNSLTPEKAYDRAQRYSEGSEVDVYYNPYNPKQAVLERIEESSLAGIIVGVLMMVGGPLMIHYIFSLLP